MDPTATPTRGDEPSGWLPRGFEDLAPEVAETVLTLVRQRLEHLQWVDRQEIAMARRGQASAVALSIFFGILSLWMTLAGHDAVGGTIAGTTIAALATAFIIGRRSPG